MNLSSPTTTSNWDLGNDWHIMSPQEQMQDVYARLNSLSDKTQQQDKIITAQSEVIEKIIKENGILRTNNEHLHSQIIHLTEGQQEVVKENRQISTEYQTLKDKYEEVQTQLREMENMFVRFYEERDELNAKIEKLSEEKKTLEGSNHQKDEVIHKLNGQLRDVTHERDAKQRTIDELQKEIVRLTNENKNKERENGQLTAEKQQLQQEKDQTTNDNLQLLDQNQLLNRDNWQLRESKNELELTLNQLREEKNSLVQQVDNKQNALIDNELRFNQQLEELQRKYNNLSTTDSNNQLQLNNLKNKLLEIFTLPLTPQNLDKYQQCLLDTVRLLNLPEERLREINPEIIRIVSQLKQSAKNPNIFGMRTETLNALSFILGIVGGGITVLGYLRK
ncbi:hypothetical protein [Candidatus Protochlamydia amoebophila]|uniref:Uncharacterized protein n=1 Tax=Protochlamydia amoebophila (strain UWE25) TaxID=264201 RepID=A0A2P9H9T4_PARUW|nr:hypothetical protein [Candidatus Protochlamydia amoebophila]SPJ31766.1 unnamed protein product [Candidatus Protochlamydia amoebophila UWE25]